MKTGLLIGLATLVAWLVWAFFGFKLGLWISNSTAFETAGQWGDTFGAFNALISGFGFVAVILTLRSQGQALKLQQKALQQQQDDLHRQRFESTFFELLRLLRDCRAQVSTKNIEGNSFNGIEAFGNALKRILTHENLGFRLPAGNNPYTQVYSKEIHVNYEVTLSPYFRVIYRILDRLRKDNVLSRQEKLSYAKLLRGQLNSSELALIGLNGKLPLAKDFSTLVTEYRLLKYLPAGAIRNELERLYPSEAFLGHED